MQNRRATCMETSLLYQKVEDLRKRTKPWSQQTDKFISQLKEAGIEILRAQLDRQSVIVWIWCHSQTALENIQKMYQTNQLRDVLFGIANIPSSVSEIIQSNVTHIDSNQFTHKIGKFF